MINYASIIQIVYITTILTMAEFSHIFETSISWRPSSCAPVEVLGGEDNLWKRVYTWCKLTINVFIPFTTILTCNVLLIRAIRVRYKVSNPKL